jgi:DNA-binding response OmpR family regulator
MPARILLVEDDPIWQGAIARRLRAAGYMVEVAQTADEAKARLGLEGGGEPGARFDLLIVDIRLPSGNEGLELAEALRQRQEQAGIPLDEQPRLIMSTVLNHIAVDTWQDRARWDAFFVKPYEVSTLVERVRALLSPEEGPARADDET